MACPSAERLQDLLDGSLPEGERDETLAHADGCTDCHALLAELTRGSGAPATFERGAAIHDFVVLDRIGAGAMGVVVSAYDPRLDRKVAIKLVRPGAGRATSMRERLLREAQAMGRLKHPNVVTVYQVGELGEDVFVAMELVDGGTLTRWLGAARRPWRQTLAIFLQVGSGLAAAHAAGLVHRDFKPDNVLVGDDGRARVGDFGLVGVSGGEPSAPAHQGDAALTRTGAVLGTPLYMAPEQHRGGPVDARADQFAFCVALYEALFGVRPFAGDTVPALLAAIEAGRFTEPARDAAAPARLRRILHRGLHADPAARYPSMDALLADLARDPGRTLRLAAVGVALAGAAAFAIARGGGGDAPSCSGGDLAGAWDEATARRAHAAFVATAAPYAEAAWQGVAGRLDAYAAAWSRMHTEACEATRRGEQSARALDLRMTCLARRRAELGALTGVLVTADAAAVQRAVSAAAAIPDVADCADVERLATPLPLPQDPPARAQIATLRAQLATAFAYEELGRYTGGLALAEPALAAARQLGYRPIAAEALLQQGTLLGLAGDKEKAEQTLFAAVVAAAAARHDEVEVDARIALVKVLGNDLGRHDEALRAGELARAILTRLGGDAKREARLLRFEGYVFDGKGAYGEARARYEQALEIERRVREPGHTNIAACLVSLGNNEFYLDHFDAALAKWREAERMLQRTLGPDHPSLAIVIANIGAALHELHRSEEALGELRRALSIQEKALGPDHPDLAVTLSTIGDEEMVGREPARAAATYKRALALLEAHTPEHPNTAAVHESLGGALEASGARDDAIHEYRRALAIREKVFGAQAPEVVASRRVLAAALARP